MGTICEELVINHCHCSPHATLTLKTQNFTNIINSYNITLTHQLYKIIIKPSNVTTLQSWNETQTEPGDGCSAQQEQEDEQTPEEPLWWRPHRRGCELNTEKLIQTIYWMFPLHSSDFTACPTGRTLPCPAATWAPGGTWWATTWPRVTTPWGWTTPSPTWRGEEGEGVHQINVIY